MLCAVPQGYWLSSRVNLSHTFRSIIHTFLELFQRLHGTSIVQLPLPKFPRPRPTSLASQPIGSFSPSLAHFLSIRYGEDGTLTWPAFAGFFARCMVRVGNPPVPRFGRSYQQAKTGLPNLLHSVRIRYEGTNFCPALQAAEVSLSLGL